MKEVDDKSFPIVSKRVLEFGKEGYRRCILMRDQNTNKIAKAVIERVI